MEEETALDGFSSWINDNKSSIDGEEGENYEFEHNKEKSKDDIETSNEKEMDENIEEPRVGMIFDSEKEIETYYANFAKKKGFVVSRRTSKNDIDGRKYFTISCARARKLVSQQSKLLKPNLTTKTQCKARLNACLGLDGKVKITSVILQHNHEMSPGKSRFFICNRKIDSHVKKKLEVNDQAGISISKKFQSFVVEAGGYENLTFTQKDCRNYIEKSRRLRLGIGDAEAIQEYFLRMQEQNSSFYYMMDLDEKCQLRNVFWADARSRVAYEYFGDVVSFDTTYLTNKYDMLFAPFVGVNHHGQSILLGCALLSNEDTKTFVWLFKTWLTCMSGKAPSAIITDQDKAMQNAIEIVFPQVRHRWCLWHVMKKVPEKLRGYSNYESIKLILHSAVYDSFTREEFMETWEKMIADYNLHENEWLNGLYNERHRWVPAYVKDTFWAGMSTTQRSESMNAFFDGYINSKTTLKQFMEQYDNTLSNMTML